MTIKISDVLIKETGLSEEALKRDLAVWLYQREIFTLAQSARFLKISRLEMQKELAIRNIDIHISEQDIEDDVADLKSLGLL